MPITWDNKKTEGLLKAILKLKNLEEAKRFFRDLLTEAELEEFGNRWLAAQMLREGKSYTTIRGKTGLSITTIARISSWLKKGTGGYRLMLNRLQLHHHNSPPVGKGLR